MLKNNKGQALIESVLILPLSMLFLLYVCQVLIYFSVEFSIDDALEDFLFCQVQKKWRCEHLMKDHLSHLPLVGSAYNFNKSGNTYSIYFETTALRLFKIKKERSLNYAVEIL